jgi:hypothetical protein
MRRRVLIAVGVIALLFVLAGLLLVFDAMKARGALLDAEDQALDLRQQVTDGNVDAARSALAGLKDSTREAEASTDGPLWAAAARIPFVGQNFAAVQTISRELSTIAGTGLQPLVDIADQVDADAFSPQKGRIDVDAIRELSPRLQRADDALSGGWREIGEIDTEGLAGPLRGPVAELQSKVDDARSTVHAGAKAARLIPDMLGGSDKRTYVLAFQNNAEIRSTGGLPGAFAILTARDGRISMGGQGAASDFPFFRSLPVKPTKDELRLYSRQLTGFWADTTFTPDFPRSAEIMRAMVLKERKRKTDGVISVDPIALSYILEATGPVTLSDGTRLTSDNTVKRLLNDVYREIPADGVARDAYFADAARRVFSAVVSGQGGSQALLTSLAKSADENRILIESTRGAEQRELAASRIGGALPTDAGPTPHLGIYYNDATATKLEYYFRQRTDVRATECTADGAQSLSTTTVLRSVAPKNARKLPRSILGPGTGEKRGSFRMVMAFYAPYGGVVTRLEVDGEEQPLNRAEHDGVNVVTVPVLLAPGQRLTVKASMFTGKGQRGDAVFSTTPGIEATPNNVTVPSACD